MKDRKLKGRFNRDGLPVNANEWTAQDWQDLHEAVEKVIRQISARHKEQREHDTKEPT